MVFASYGIWTNDTYSKTTCVLCVYVCVCAGPASGALVSIGRVVGALKPAPPSGVLVAMVGASVLVAKSNVSEGPVFEFSAMGWLAELS